MSDETKDKHTPGPWISAGVHVEDAHHHRCVADCNPRRESRVSTVEALRNSLLISASPDLLAALVLCVEDYEDELKENDAWQMLHVGKVERAPTPYHIMAARAAIDKARNGA